MPWTFPMRGFNCLNASCLVSGSKALRSAMSLLNWVAKSSSRPACDSPTASLERDSGCLSTAAYVARSLVGSLSVLHRFWNISGLNKEFPSSQADTVSFWRPSTSKGCKFERTVMMPMHGVCPLKKHGQVKHFGGLQPTSECAVYTLRCIHISHITSRRVCGECKLRSVYTTHSYMFVSESCHSKPVKSTTCTMRHSSCAICEHVMCVVVKHNCTRAPWPVSPVVLPLLP